MAEISFLRMCWFTTIVFVFYHAEDTITTYLISYYLTIT